MECSILDFLGGNMIQELIKTLLLVFIAEIGDKTQLLLITCAARFSIIQVLIGIIIGVFLNHGLAILIGTYISNIINSDFLQIVAGIIFIIFGLITLLSNGKEEESNNQFINCGPVLTVATAFFLGELGDKTQLTAMTIAMEAKYPLLILAGSIVGMLLVGLIGIIIGTTLTKKVSSNIIRLVSAIAFIAFGVAKISTKIKINLFECSPLYMGIYILLIFFASLYLLGQLDE